MRLLPLFLLAFLGACKDPGDASDKEDTAIDSGATVRSRLGR